MLKVIRYNFRLYRLVKIGDFFAWKNTECPGDYVGLSGSPEEARRWALSHTATPVVGRAA